MESGKLDRRIVIERAALTANAFGEGVPTWAPLAEVWAHKQDVSDKERQQSAEVSAEITTRFRIRWSPDVATLNPKDRIVFDGRTFEIWGVKEIGRREGLEISATARAER
jgi:SPP1 family predicted phage head-tail adaptor